MWFKLALYVRTVVMHVCVHALNVVCICDRICEKGPFDNFQIIEVFSLTYYALYATPGTFVCILCVCVCSVCVHMYVCMLVYHVCTYVCAAVGKAYEALQDEEQVAFCKDIAEEAKKQLETRVRAALCLHTQVVAIFTLQLMGQ